MSMAAVRAYRSCAQRVTRLPSFRQCAGSRSSALHNMKSSIGANSQHEQCMYKSDVQKRFISTPVPLERCRYSLTIVVLAERSDEKRRTLERCAGCSQFLHLGNIARHRRWVIVWPFRKSWIRKRASHRGALSQANKFTAKLWRDGVVVAEFVVSDRM